MNTATALLCEASAIVVTCDLSPHSPRKVNVSACQKIKTTPIWLVIIFFPSIIMKIIFIPIISALINTVTRVFRIFFEFNLHFWVCLRIPKLCFWVFLLSCVSSLLLFLHHEHRVNFIELSLDLSSFFFLLFRANKNELFSKNFHFSVVIKNVI